jgi:hypothetical protein
MAGDEDPLAGPLTELRSAWDRLTQTVSNAWQEAQDTIHFGDNVIPRAQLARIIYAASKLADHAYEWENVSDRRRHSVQLRRLAVLRSNLDSLSIFIEGGSVEISDGDILSVTDPGEGEDTPKQRKAPRADGPDESEKMILAKPVFMLRGQDKAALGTVTAYRGLAEEEGASDEVLDSIDGAIEGFREFAYANPDKMKVAD